MEILSKISSHPLWPTIVAPVIAGLALAAIPRMSAGVRRLTKSALSTQKRIRIVLFVFLIALVATAILTLWDSKAIPTVSDVWAISSLVFAYWWLVFKLSALIGQDG